MKFYPIASALKRISGLTWLWAGFLIVSATFMRQVLNLLLSLIGEQGVRSLVWTAFLLPGLFIISSVWRRGGMVRSARLSGLLLLGALYALSLEISEERIHLVKYGILGWLIGRDLFDMAKNCILLLALAGGALVACADESLQSFLPYRVGDPRDVLFGIIGAVWGAALFRLYLTPSRGGWRG